jgi:general transcription factor 3C polypeptide 3 (transcription factor C subunit 4)
MGRAAQQLGLMHLALEFYNRVLETEPPPPEQGQLGRGRGPGPARDLDLRREAAHNMALIYRASGADELAREVLRQHLSV